MPQACVAQPYNQNTCVLCYSILSRRDSREKLSVCRETEEHHLSSFWCQEETPESCRQNKDIALTEGILKGACKKNHRRNPIFPAPYYPENTQSSRFEGANPPTAVFLVMTHKIPHNSDTIFLIKPATKMKLYIWCLKKKKKKEEGKKKDKTLLVVISS